MHNYKSFREEFMENHNGTTSWETLSIIVPSFFEVFIATVLASIILNNIPNISKFKCVLVHFIVDFLFIIIPLILAVTYLQQYAYYLLVLLFFLTTAIILRLSPKTNVKTIPKDNLTNSKRPFITNARSTITIISIIAILAVDFKIFPRRFAKTETYGYSLMDVGVGLFVFSNGLVAPEINKRRQKLLKSVISSTPLWLLGIARLFITNELDYQVPVSEYGVHWNFFITLAVTKILSSCILALFNVNHSLLISVFILVLHEYLLQTKLGSWAIETSSRHSFLLANREGIVSSMGYVGLYFLSVHFGKTIANTNNNPNFKLSITLLVSSLVLLFGTILLELNFGISRRLANAGYCLWIMFIGIFMVFLFHCGENLSKYLYDNSSQKYKIYVPVIFEAVSFNGLAFFLLGNILTGLINISINTLNVGTLASFIIIVIYMFVICSIISILFVNNIKLKFW